MPSNDKMLLAGILSRTDVAYLKCNKQLIEDSFISIARSVRFLGFYDDKNILKTKDEKANSAAALTLSVTLWPKEWSTRVMTETWSLCVTTSSLKTRRKNDGATQARG